MKKCITCYQGKTLDQFYKKKNSNNFYSQCKKCSIQKLKDWSIENPERYKDKKKQAAKGFRKRLRDKVGKEGLHLYDIKRHYKKMFNMTLDDYDLMFNAQGGVCAICRRPETTVTNGIVKRLYVDHCHSTNEVRGLLCHKCNFGLGYFKESKILLKNATDYLDKYSAEDSFVNVNLKLLEVDV